VPLQAVTQNRGFIKLITLIAALIIVGWGGWVMYKRNGPASSEKSVDTNAVVSEQNPPAADTLVISSRHDSVKIKRADSIHPVTTANDSGTYKFIILSTPNKEHALRRYNQLLSFDLKAHLFQKDSTWFKVYFQFPARAKDTLHIKDSLRREYAHNVIIEP
jgi:hypothetical protein